MNQLDLFDDVFDLPDPDADERFNELVGLDAVKESLLKQGTLLINPTLLDDWSRTHHGSVLPGVTAFHRRPHLLLFSGDVGTGKTTLANSFASPIARQEHIGVKVMRLSLITRGQGAVGQMTTLITRAFEAVNEEAGKGIGAASKPRAATVLIVDEADALAQSRATDQMHHEDRAGVNALIRGIDRLSRQRLPALVVLCTNQHDAIDPAVLRRAASHYRFKRPSTEQIVSTLGTSLPGVFKDDELQRLAVKMGPGENQKFGYTFSDITQRYLPALFLQGYPDRKITFQLASDVVEQVEPTKPFEQSSGGTGHDA